MPQKAQAAAEESTEDYSHGVFHAGASLDGGNHEDHDAEQEPEGQPEIHGTERAARLLHVFEPQLGLAELRDLGRATVRAAEDALLEFLAAVQTRDEPHVIRVEFEVIDEPRG